MSSKRSYLDNLNAGRQRRSGTALEEINRTLDKLERRLGGDERREATGGDEDMARRIQRLSDEALAAEPANRRPDPAIDKTPHAGQERLAREIEDARRQEDQRASIGNIAAELGSLRQEMRSMVGSSLRGEFDQLRKELSGIMEAVPPSPLTDELNAEFARLSRAIALLAERSDDRNANLLRLELEQVRASLANLAREETVRSPDQRWNAVEDKMAPRAQEGRNPGMETLHARLAEISAAVDRLPETLPLRSLEERVKALADSLDQFALQHDRGQPDLRALIEERMDEISRAITASTARAAFDPRPFERIEARIASLANQINELVEAAPDGMVIERLNHLTDRVDEIARRIDLPEQAVERLATHVAQIAQKLDAAPLPPDADGLFLGLEERFAALSRMVEQRQEDALMHSQGLLQDLERRLQDVAERLDRAGSGVDESGLMAAMDSRFAELAAHIDNAREPGESEALRVLEARLEDISDRLRDTASAGPSVDPETIGNLESQIAALSAHLARPAADEQRFEALAPRLESIERSIGESRAGMLDAARRAAEQAVQSLGPAHAEAGDDSLKDDLQRLEALARKSEERNSKTFEAIHDTLLKIVERLGSLEQAGPEDATAVAAGPVDAAPAHSDTSDHADTVPPAPRTPAQAATEAADAALKEDDGSLRSKETRQSLLGGLSRAFGGRTREEEAPARKEPSVAETAEGDEGAVTLGAEHADEPLEPGSGAPDLNAIIRRVRDERERNEAERDDTAKADFIAAARRAAQAAAAEAEMLKDRKGGESEKVRKGGLLRGRKRTLLLAAAGAIIVAGGLYYLRATIPGEEQVAERAPSAEVEVQAQATSAPDMQDAAPDTQGAVPARFAGMSEPSVESIETAAISTQPPPQDESQAGEEPAAPTAHQDDEAQADTAIETAVPEPLEIPGEIGPAALRKAAANGEVAALYELGNRFAEGVGVEQDMAEAARWYEKAAELGLAAAQYRIGHFYEKGSGIERDIAKAKMWYQLAAEQGNASAMHNLGVLFAMGADGTPDNESAARWFQEAADLGVTDSQFNLGILAAKGVGMRRDLSEAYKWFDIVARAGDTDAAVKRDEIAATMAPADLAKAQGKAKLWEAREADPAANVVDIPDAWLPDETVTGSVDLKKAVANIQRILNDSGYEAGPADGVLGARTRTAIKAFQKENGMAETGEIDAKLVRALLERQEASQ
ncbi:peptidoglycan-binding protein [Chelativorans sp. M5D2P16]|uniref:peptidoglycan-binding protein n=1 Tax=Chelativorans sp. M5D2P16 TaxID=3095678 RepID=UPI002ACAA35C|nr:peptidoglycan-binding protein [Chelativorans sp. M5D2P16]MDZ5697161.1 peptidoglycan-binding protein [Chelativorans sp. M5D2P16]